MNTCSITYAVSPGAVQAPIFWLLPQASILLQKDPFRRAMYALYAA